MKRGRFAVGAGGGLLAAPASVGCASHEAAVSRAALAATGSTYTTLEGVWEGEVWEIPSDYIQGVRRIAVKVSSDGSWPASTGGAICATGTAAVRDGLVILDGHRGRPCSVYAPFPQGRRRTHVGRLRNVVQGGAHRGGDDRSQARRGRRRSGRGCGQAMTTSADDLALRVPQQRILAVEPRYSPPGKREAYVQAEPALTLAVACEGQHVVTNRRFVR